MVEAPFENYVRRIGSYLNLIPPLPQTSGGLDSQVLELFDDQRKKFLQSLGRIAQEEAQKGCDPSITTEVALPHIDRLFSDHVKLDLILSFAIANHEFGNDPVDLLAQASNLAQSRRDAEMFARLGEAQARIGMEPTGFINADECLAEMASRYLGNGKGELDYTGHLGKVVLSKLRAGHVEAARQTIDRLSLDDFWKGIAEEELQEAFDSVTVSLVEF